MEGGQLSQCGRLCAARIRTQQLEPNSRADGGPLSKRGSRPSAAHTFQNVARASRVERQGAAVALIRG
eukprot:9250273-Pyramimonas_sp.AAC.1